jgi:hypothetical protein
MRIGNDLIMCGKNWFSFLVLSSNDFPRKVKTSIPDPDGYGPPWSVIRRHGSGSFHAKIVLKNCVSTVLRLHDFLSSKNDVNVSSKSNEKKKLDKNYLLLVSWRSLTKRAGSGSVSQGYGSADPDLYQNVTDPQHWWKPSSLSQQMRSVEIFRSTEFTYLIH